MTTRRDKKSPAARTRQSASSRKGVGGRPGGPSVLTAARRRAFFHAVLSLATRKACAAAAGVHPDTIRAWLARGAKDERAERVTEFSEFFVQFRDVLGRAEAEAVARIRAAGKRGDWRADAWLLERRRPSDFGKKDFHKLSAERATRSDGGVVFVLDTVPGGSKAPPPDWIASNIRAGSDDE